VEDLKLVPDLVEDADAEPLGPLEDEMRSEYSQDTISDSESCQSENEDLLSVKEMDTSSVAEVIFEDRIQNTALSPEDLAEVCHIYATDAPEYHETSPELSILSYNVRCDKDKWPYDWKSRFAPVVDVISSSNTDIVCLQEARHQFAQDVVAALGSQWCGTGQPRRQKDEGTQILYNADRLIFIRSSTFVLTDSGPTACPPASACSAPSIFSGKRCKHVRIFTHSLFTDFSMEVKLHVLNTHFPLEESEQLLCARQIRNYVARSIPATEAVMLCGDLNSHYAPETTGTPLDALLGEMQDCHGMQDFPTYAEGFLPETLERPRGAHRLDYMLLRPSESVTCLAATMLEPRYRAANGTVSRPSDHEPLRVVLSF
jgi:endonuclease/exonuclease/phosphatase family metal-dependent hydrolase